MRRLKARGARVLTTGLIVALIALTFGEMSFAPHYRPVFPWHHVAGYSAVIGLLAACAFTVFTYFALKPLLQRPDEESGVGSRESGEKRRTGE